MFTDRQIRYYTNEIRDCLYVEETRYSEKGRIAINEDAGYF